MKLRDLDGEFVGRVSIAPKVYSRLADIDGAQGVLFQCPLCSTGKPPGEGGGFAGAHYVLICFANPRNAEPAPAEFDDNPRWTMEGTSLDDITLSPSVNLNVPNEKGEPPMCRWHGWVKNGDAA